MSKHKCFSTNSRIPKSQITFLPKDLHFAKDFIEVVYNGELLHFMGRVPQGLLMEDGALVHRSKLCEEWRQTHLLEKLDWPTNSPNFNPIENLWKILKDVVQHGLICPKNLDDLKIFIEREWRLISGTKLLQFYHSMPSRLHAVIEANGGHTRYLVDFEYFFYRSFDLQFWHTCFNMKYNLCQKFHGK